MRRQVRVPLGPNRGRKNNVDHNVPKVRHIFNLRLFPYFVPKGTTMVSALHFLPTFLSLRDFKKSMLLTVRKEIQLVIFEK